MLTKYLLHEWIYLTTTEAAGQNKNDYHKIKILKEVSHELYTLTLSVGVVTY